MRHQLSLRLKEQKGRNFRGRFGTPGKLPGPNPRSIMPAPSIADRGRNLSWATKFQLCAQSGQAAFLNSSRSAREETCISTEFEPLDCFSNSCFKRVRIFSEYVKYSF